MKVNLIEVCQRAVQEGKHRLRILKWWRVPWKNDLKEFHTYVQKVKEQHHSHSFIAIQNTLEIGYFNYLLTISCIFSHASTNHDSKPYKEKDFAT